MAEALLKLVNPVCWLPGETGFLGGQLCKRLLSEGYSVLCMDNLRIGSFEDVAYSLKEPNLEYIDHDVSTHMNVPGEMDQIYHFASPASSKYFAHIPIPILQLDAVDTYNCLGLASNAWCELGSEDLSGRCPRL